MECYKNNLVPIEIEEGVDQINQDMADGGGRQLVMKEYADPLLGLQCHEYSWVKRHATIS